MLAKATVMEQVEEEEKQGCTCRDHHRNYWYKREHMYDKTIQSNPSTETHLSVLAPLHHAPASGLLLIILAAHRETLVFEELQAAGGDGQRHCRREDSC